ncbi:MAG: DUF1919 domain-containing protein [Thomasclavelia spiroformis]
MGLRNKQSTLILNNCIGRYVYQFFGIEYKSPTTGIFLTKDYLKFYDNTKYYISQESIFISLKKVKIIKNLKMQICLELT